MQLKLNQDRAKETTGKEIPVFHTGDFDEMIEKTKPDVVIVTTVDGYHHKYVIRGMELSCDVITEKPMTIDAEKCQQIIDIQKKTGNNCKVLRSYLELSSFLFTTTTVKSSFHLLWLPKIYAASIICSTNSWADSF